MLYDTFRAIDDVWGERTFDDIGNQGTGFIYTGDFHPIRSRPCRAYTSSFSGSQKSAPAEEQRWDSRIDMILWTIQTEEAWSELQVGGMLHVTRENITESNWIHPYEWIIDQMKMHLGPPPEPGCFPIWAWYQWENESRRKPDLCAAGHLSKGQKGVRIEFECCDEAALLSDFDLWHYVLNYWYLPESEAEGEEFELELKQHGLSFFDTKPLPNPKFHDRIVKSWNRIFDLSWFEEDLVLPLPRKSIQATLWEISIDQVRNYTHFKSR